MAIVILLIGVLAFLWNVYDFHVERWDDAYIVFRYAQHLLEGHGLVWNVGGERSEGYTSPLHLLLVAASMGVGLSPWSSTLFIGVLAALGTVVVAVHVLRRQLGRLHVLSVTAAALYLADASTATHATSGLETHVFVLSLALACTAALAFVDDPRPALAASFAATVVLSILVRPEGALYGAALFMVLGVQAFRTPSEAETATRIRLLLVAGALMVAVGAAYAVWKYSYFGYVLPNAYYVKSDRIGLAGIVPVALYVGHLALVFGPGLAAVALCLGVRWRELIPATRDLASRTRLLILLGPPVLALAYYSTIVHEMGEEHRFSYPTYFFFVLAAGMVLARAARVLSGLGIREARVAAAALFYLGVAAAAQADWRIDPTPPSAIFTYHSLIGDALQRTGLGAGGRIICDAAGVIPYMSGFTHIDRIGLTDNRLSGREPMTVAERERYLWSQRADVYVGYEPPASPGAEHAPDDPRIATWYVADVLLTLRLGAIGDRILLRDRDSLHGRMRELRDGWIWLGELDWPGWQLWRLKSFVYVRRDSPHLHRLLPPLRGIIARPDYQVRLGEPGIPAPVED